MISSVGVTDEGSFRGNRQNVFEPAKDTVLGDTYRKYMSPLFAFYHRADEDNRQA
jgi:hypothetical protein